MLHLKFVPRKDQFSTKNMLLKNSRIIVDLQSELIYLDC